MLLVLYNARLVAFKALTISVLKTISLALQQVKRIESKLYLSTLGSLCLLKAQINPMGAHNARTAFLMWVNPVCLRKPPNLFVRTQSPLSVLDRVEDTINTLPELMVIYQGKFGNKLNKTMYLSVFNHKITLFRVYETASIVSSDIETTSFQSETTGRHTALSECSSVSRLHVAGRKRPQRRRKQRIQVNISVCSIRMEKKESYFSGNVAHKFVFQHN